MFQAIYRNAQESQSVELTMASFQLLKDLEMVCDTALFSFHQPTSVHLDAVKQVSLTSIE